MNRLAREKQLRVVSTLVEGCSIRATERMCEVHRDTVMRLGLTVGEACQRLHDALVRALHVDLLQLDEIWSFIGKKQRRLVPGDDPELGDQYTYLGIDAIRKAIISFEVGKRTAETTQRFARDLRSRILNRPQITTDGYVPYIEAIELAFGAEADYAMTIEPAEGRSQRARKIVIVGTPDPVHISTSYAERQNLTVRMGQRRFTRMTNAFSKKLCNHKAAVALYVAHYNFCRVHETLRTTPAVALDVTSHVWSIAELIDVVLSIVPPEPELDRRAALPQPARAARPLPRPARAPETAPRPERTDDEVPRPTPTGEPRPVGHAEVEQLARRLGAAAQALGWRMQTRKPSLGGVQDIYEYQLTRGVMVAIGVPQGGARIGCVVLRGTGTNQILIEAIGLVVEVLTGSKLPEKRSRILRQLGASAEEGGAAGVGRISVGGWHLALGHTDEYPVWMVAEKIARDV